MPKLLVKWWEKAQYAADIFGDRNVYVSCFFGECSLFFADNEVVVKEDVRHLVTYHEKADTQVCVHISDADGVEVNNISVRASDTEIAVIYLHHYRRLHAKL